MSRRISKFFVSIFLLGDLSIVGASIVPPVSALGDLGQLILGEWQLQPNPRATEGSVVFSEKGTYELFERHPDGAGVSTKGQYRLDEKSFPSRIDLCLDKCGKAGSEWTTRFGIIRMLSDGKVEIRTSPDATYPQAFAEDPTSDEYTMILTR
jgi:hypothetical protein